MTIVPDIHACVDRLRAGGLVAFPTETVYGLGADALNERAVRRVFELKGRPANNPLIVHVSGPAMAREVVRAWPPGAERLAEAFWPGPLSIVLQRAPQVPAIVSAGGDTIAVRCPDHPLTLALLRAFGGPLVGPSANLSGRVSPTAASHVRDAFPGDEVLVLDGGECRVGIESTVLSLVGGPARVLRPGVLGAEQIAGTLGAGVSYEAPADAAPDGSADAGAPLASPGLLASHYAPARRAVLTDAPGIQRLVREGHGLVVALAISDLSLPQPHEVIPMPEFAEDYAHAMYTALRMADTPRTGVIAIERPPEGDTPEDRAIWRAVLDRLTRAAGVR
ncbi:MAG: L-threonylcarbamoyladenylate synthase [Planctomycetota bacterium]|nr:L-threonylcarbamoyladenylate synthase [Planctomycetota bacterium]